MKQLLQNLGSGETVLAEVPAPQAQPGSLLIQTSRTLVSAGTERMLVEFGKANLLEKARSQPDKVKQVLDKIKTDGLFPTLEAVRSKLDQPLPLGYCNAGVIMEAEIRGQRSEVSGQRSEIRGQRSEVSGQWSGFQPGDRVVSNGPHAEIVSVPHNLCAKIPDGVSDEQAAFTILGSVALQGMRLANPSLGERFVVYGLGLIGLLAVQLLRANGCEVLGVDISAKRLKLAEEFGATAVLAGEELDPVASVLAWSGGAGVDGVLITASAKTDEIVHAAAQMCRKRGRIVLVGVVGLNLRRADFYEKELSFQVSCSYGPGRYDPEYEQKGHDYPLGYVRWTEQRNFQAVLELLRSGRLRVDELVTRRVPFAEALSVYSNLGGDPSALGVILQYPEKPDRKTTVQFKTEAPRSPLLAPCSPPSDLRPLTSPAPSSPVVSGPVVPSSRAPSVSAPGSAPSAFSLQPSALPSLPVVGLIGAGNFTGQVLLPALKKTGARLKVIASANGVSGAHLGRKFGIEESTTDVDSLFDDPQINIVMIATRHNIHARYVVQALRAGKHVFVEKPLCLNETELTEIASAYSSLATRHSPLLLMVGFNRRFAPQITEIKRLLNTTREPKALVMTVNAGAVPVSHWVQDPEVGGGRIIGEACHFIDLFRFLVGCPIKEVQASKMGETGGPPCADKVVCSLGFADGSLGTILYLANGHKSFPKERLEVFCAGRILQLDNFRRLTGFGWPGFRKLNLWRQDKGHAGEMAAFIAAVRAGSPAPTSFAEIQEVTQVTFEVARQAAASR